MINLDDISTATLRILDNQGRLVSEQTLQTGENELSLSAYSAGIYLFQILTEEGSMVQKVFKHE